VVVVVVVVLVVVVHGRGRTKAVQSRVLVHYPLLCMPAVTDFECSILLCGSFLPV